MTMLVLAVSRPVPRVVAEEAAGRRGEPSGDVVPRQTVEAETVERRRHRPLAMRVRRGMAAPTPTALDKRQAIGINKRSHSRNVVSR